MGYDAFTPGEVDLSWGVDKLLRISKQAKFAFLLANLMDRQSKKPVFRSYLVKKLEGMKIGFLGLISNRLHLSWSPGEEAKFYLADPIVVAKKVVTELKKRKSEVIIAIAHMEQNDQVMLLKNVPEIDFVISGHVRESLSVPFTPGNIKTQILLAGTGGERMGEIAFSMEQKQLKSRFRLVSLTGRYPDHIQTEKLVQQYRADLRKIFEAMEKASTPGEIPAFVGDHSCISCHPQQHQNWQKTGHARAYKTLIQNNKNSDLTCLVCHATGLGKKIEGGGFLENVQCEACHGPRKGHAENGQKFPPVSEKQCVVCHNPAKSPKFDYASYLSKVRCPPSK